MGYRLDFLKDSSRKLGHSARIIASKIGESIIKVGKKIIIAAIAILVSYIIIIITMNAYYCNSLKGTCIEADEFGGKSNVINAKPQDENAYTLKNDYKHNEFTQKVIPTDLNMALNGDPIIINITGEWIPWFGDLDQVNFKKYSPNRNFLCAVEKYTISGQDFKFSNKEEENEFYYIRNYYARIKTPTIDKNNKKIIEGIEEPPERQKECWLNGGIGLYMASFGLNGRTEPTAYHHLKADKLICNKAHWFNGKALKGDSLNRNYVITKYGEGNSKSYRMSDFITNYFSVSYYSDPEGYMQNYGKSDWKSTESEYDKDILVETENQIIYNIGVHEKKLEERLARYRDSNIEINEFRKNISYGFIVANSKAKFMQACYQISKDLNGDESRSYRSYFQYGPKTLYKNMENVQNIKYEYGEKIKMLILDKFYENNSGFYKIEIISGIEFDDADFIEKKIKEVEFYLLGTPSRDGKRSDGMIARIFNNVLSSGFALFAKAILMLYVVYYGYRIIFGFKKDRNDRSVINNKDLMITLVKFVVIAVFLSPSAFSFFSELILSSVIDGTIGIIDLIAGVFSNNFNDNAIALTGGLKYANEVRSLARNFAIVDEILNFFTNKVILSKVIGFAFNFTQTFGSGLIISIGTFLVLLFYVYKLIQSIVPFIFVLLQFTLALPLAPVFILFVLFKETSYIFQNWVRFILSKSLELIGFFTAFYFCTSIINNFIKQLLNYRVCFKGLGDKLFPDVDDKVGVSSFGDFIEGNWVKELIKKILNNFLAVSIEGLPDNYFIHYMINILITAALVFMFDIMLRETMNIINSILTIDGATANTGGKNAMAAAASGDFSLDKQFKEFSGTMGLATIQNESNLLKGTKNVFDLEKGVTRNLLNLGKKLTMPVKAGIQALSGDREGAKKTMMDLANTALDVISPATSALTTLPFVGDKIEAGIDRVRAYNEKKKKDSGWSDAIKQVKNIWSNSKNKSETNILLSKTSDDEFVEYLKTLDDYTAEKIFGKNVAENIKSTALNSKDNSKEISNLRNYLTRYQANKYMKEDMEDLNYDVFSEDYGRSNEELLTEAINSKNKDSANVLKILKNSKKKTITKLFGEESADSLKKTVVSYETIKIKKNGEWVEKEYEVHEIEDIEKIEEYMIENMEKALANPSLKNNESINRDVTSEDYGRKNKFIAIDNVLLNKDKDTNQLKAELKEFVDKNEKLAKDLLETKEIEAIREEKFDEVDMDKVINSLKQESLKEVKVKTDENGNTLSIIEGESEYKIVTEGENEYKIKLFDKDDDYHKKGDPAAIFDQDGTKIFEVKDADCIIKVDNIQYIVESTKGGDGGTIINIYKDNNGAREELTAAEKTAELQARIEKNMQKFDKMMEEVKKLDENKK